MRILSPMVKAIYDAVRVFLNLKIHCFISFLNPSIKPLIKDVNAPTFLCLIRKIPLLIQNSNRKK